MVARRQRRGDQERVSSLDHDYDDDYDYEFRARETPISSLLTVYRSLLTSPDANAAAGKKLRAALDRDVDGLEALGVRVIAFPDDLRL
ncbi:MAG TPA: hypothetical protein PLG17_07045 [Thermodesulfobacteriota bacterium]|nr:hypothetical protein [Thermodesulfobacteriota bacterium]